jgi:LasA protease
VKRILYIIVILGLIQTACGASTSPLWGTYMTPTPPYEMPIIPTFNTDLPPVPVPTATYATATPPPTPTQGVLSATPTLAPGQIFIEPTLTPTFNVAPILYYSQSGDTVPSIAKRFNVTEEEVTSSEQLSPTDLIKPGTLLIIPDRIDDNTAPNIQIMPDSEIVFSGTAVDFNITAYVKQAGGHLSTYREFLSSTGWLTGAQIIERAADENSINPRLLLAILEYESRWVTGQSIDALHADYPMGFVDLRYKSGFMQLVWAVNQLSTGYYGWRAGTLTELEFPDGTKLRLDPNLNAGTVAIQYLFSRLHSQSQWSQIINPETGFPAIYAQMFGDPWARAELVNPIFPPGLVQPPMVLPFEPNTEWNYSGGPHGAWEHDGALAAIDFAPSTDHGGCDPTPTWVVASASGLVVRSDNGVVMLDLDGDGYEQTGWNLLYLHIGAKDRVKVGTWVEANDRLGHASCEGGVSTGTHLHFARKYNGEWLPADGPIPFVLDGWQAKLGKKPYEGMLINGDRTIRADPVGQPWSIIFRDTDVTPTPTP